MTVFGNLANGKYTNNVPLECEVIAIDCDNMTGKEVREAQEKNAAQRREARLAYTKEQGRLTNLLRADLEAEYGVADNPKAARLWAMAWEMGHSDGYNDIAIHYSNLVELILP